LRVIIAAVFVVLAAGYVVYSQTLAFHWDEGFHLLAAHAIRAGKTPYLDFCFPQAPLNAYWNAAWLRAFGDSWRATHIASTLLLLGSIVLTAQYVRSRFPDARWRSVATLAAVIMFGLNVFVVEYGPIAQAYAFSMFMMAAAFRASVAAVERPAWFMAALAGLAAGAAVSATMLTALAGPVFLLWILIYNQSGSRIAKFAGFSAGSLAALSPIIYLFVKAPQQAWFNLVQYQLKYRRADWPGAGVHDLDVLTAWINRSQHLILILLTLAAVGLLRRAAKEDLDKSFGDGDVPPESPSRAAPFSARGERAPFLLCLWVAIAVGLQNGFAHPTFIQYFMPMTPSVAILATLGLYAVAIRLETVDRPGRLLAALSCLYILGLGRGLFDDRDSYTWRRVEEVAKKVQDVTPPDGTLLAAEQIYFLTHRPVPPGMEFGFAHKLDLGAKRNALLDIVPQAELEARIAARAYSTDVICDDGDEVDRVDGLGLYAQKADFGECTVFWEFKPPAGAK